MLTIPPDGNYSGTMYLDTGDQDFRGAITVVNVARARYLGSTGAGRVTLEEHETLHPRSIDRDGGRPRVAA